MFLRITLIVAVGFVAASAAAQQDGKLDGKWKLKHYERGGMEKSLPKKDVATVAGGKLTLGLLGEGLPYKLDAAKSPKHIDVMNAGTNKRQTWAGIYELDGDTLKLAFATGSDQTRPKEFSSKGDSSYMYFILERIK